MSHYNVAVIRGDGIGLEVIEEGIKVLDAVGREYGIDWTWIEHPWGSEFYREHGIVMPSDALDTLAESDVIFLGAVGHPDFQDHITLGGLLLPIRRSFDQYVCERPSVLYDGINSPIKGYEAGDIDMVVVRENTEGEYADVGGFVYPDFPEELGIQSAVFTRKGCERIMRHAFEVARRRNKAKHVTSITKSNALGYGMLVWDRAFDRVASEYPDVGDQLTTRGRGLHGLYTAARVVRRCSWKQSVRRHTHRHRGDNYRQHGPRAKREYRPAERRYPSMFEPVHGSAPDIIGQGIANPLAAILSGAMMLRHLGEGGAADSVEKAALSVVSLGETLTPDLGGTSSTQDVGDAVASALT